MENEQISLPSLILIVVLGGLVIRYLFFSPTVTTTPQPRDATAAARQREVLVDRLQQMFPQVERRTILWDLQRNGNSIAATTERILAGRMETPPVTFQPPPPPTSATASSSSAQTQAQSARSKPAETDLITRYKLQAKVGSTTEEDEEDSSATKSKGKAWSSSSEERQKALQRRRDEMILAARRKMEAKLAAEKSAGSTA